MVCGVPPTSTLCASEMWLVEFDGWVQRTRMRTRQLSAACRIALRLVVSEDTALAPELIVEPPRVVLSMHQTLLFKEIQVGPSVTPVRH